MSASWHDLLHPGDAADFFERRAFPAFHPETAAYDPSNALWLAELSRLVYRHDAEEETRPPQPSRTRFVEKCGLRQTRFFNAPVTGTQAMLLESLGAEPFAILVFRGTEQTLRDFMTDLETGPPLQDGRANVHEGFANALQSVWDEIADALQALACPIFYAGHSLGGALATLAAARHAPRAVYTYGAPRVGNREFAASLAHAPIYRIVDDDDVIATLPPTLLGFEHVGVEVRLASLPESLLDRLKRLFAPPKPLADHAPINYVDRIKL